MSNRFPQGGSRPMNDAWKNLIPQLWSWPVGGMPEVLWHRQRRTPNRRSIGGSGELARPRGCHQCRPHTLRCKGAARIAGRADRWRNSRTACAADGATRPRKVLGGRDSPAGLDLGRPRAATPISLSGVAGPEPGDDASTRGCRSGGAFAGTADSTLLESARKQSRRRPTDERWRRRSERPSRDHVRCCVG